MAGLFFGGVNTEIITGNISRVPVENTVNFYVSDNDTLHIKKSNGDDVSFISSASITSLIETASGNNTTFTTLVSANLSQAIASAILSAGGDTTAYVEQVSANLAQSIAETNTSITSLTALTSASLLSINGITSPDTRNIDISGLGGIVIGSEGTTITISAAPVDLSDIYSNISTLATSATDHEVRIESLETQIGGIGSILNGQEQVIVEQAEYTITHAEITGASFPVVSLTVPSASATLYVQGIYNVTTTGFDVVLSGLPDQNGYYINWQRSSPGTINVGGGSGTGAITVNSISNVTSLNFTGIGIESVTSTGPNEVTIAISGGGSATPGSLDYNVMGFSPSSSNELAPDEMVIDASLFSSADVSIKGYGKLMVPTNMQNGQSINVLFTQDLTPYDWGMEYDNGIEFPMGVPVIPSSGAESTTMLTLVKIRNRYFATGLTEFI